MPGRTWIPPVTWAGPDAALYYSCDSSDGFMLMEGTQEMGPVPPVCGQVILIKVEEIIQCKFSLQDICPFSFSFFQNRSCRLCILKVSRF